MKKLFVLAACAVMTLASCNQFKKAVNSTNDVKNDSLRAIIDARDNEINDMMGTLNQIQQGFSEINAAEDRVTLVKDGERADKATQIKENIQFIAQRMKENRELIAKLQQQLKDTGFRGSEMKRAIETLTAQLVKKDAELKKLRADLESKNIHIKELDETITGLNTDVSNLKTTNQNLSSESNQKSETISTQERQLNTGWYIAGSKKELKSQGILEGGKVLQGNFNRGAFNRIDIRTNREINLNSRSAKILTSHPGSSYSLNKGADGNMILRINDPQTFWSTSKYLVIQVK